MEKDRSQCTDSVAGLGKRSRGQLAAVLRKAGGAVTPKKASEVLDLSQVDAAKLLARWSSQGWLQRVRQGIYVPVALESERADSAAKDAWVIADTAFSPCFVSGWSAAEHWGLTEQVFRTVSISTLRRPRVREQSMSGIVFKLRTVSKKEFFGLKTVWRDGTRVQVTDPSRTLIDMLADPILGGGIRSTADVFQNYLGSKDFRDVPQLLAYAKSLGVGAVFKRLGYLLERFAPEEQDAIAICAKLLSKGNANLDPSLPGEKLVTAWRLWLPKGWSAE